jgi:NADPH2 dehydrogenase
MLRPRYLIDQFTQTTCNKRPASDPYSGATVDQRIRFALEVAHACCDAIGADRVGLRLSPFSVFQGMKMSDPEIHETFPALISGLPVGMSYLHLVESRIAGNADVESTCSLYSCSCASSTWPRR